jgi:ATP-dependent exoDNAse (exonuclease V) beta subunit
LLQSAELAHPRPPPHQQTPAQLRYTLEVDNPLEFIWLTEDEIAELETRYGIELAAGGAPRSITGHLDFLQVRNDAVHILDYKPDARTNKPIAQLAIYALALTIRVPGLKLFDIKCAWFNEEEYDEFFPRMLLAKCQK